MIWNTRQTPLWVIAAVVAVSYAMPPFFLFFVDRQDWFHLLRNATAGLITITFQNYAVMLPAIVGGFILFTGRLRPRDVGLISGKLLPGVAFTIALWAFVNLVIVVTVFWTSDLPTLFLTGTILAVICLATENLFVAVGTHALINNSMQVVHSPSDRLDSSLIALGAVLAASVIWYFARVNVRAVGRLPH